MDPLQIQNVHFLPKIHQKMAKNAPYTQYCTLDPILKNNSANSSFSSTFNIGTTPPENAGVSENLPNWKTDFCDDFLWTPAKYLKITLFGIHSSTWQQKHKFLEIFLNLGSSQEGCDGPKFLSRTSW